MSGETATAEGLPVEAITGTLLHRAWLKSGRQDPLLDADAWDGFALTVRAVATLEGLSRRHPDLEHQWYTGALVSTDPPTTICMLCGITQDSCRCGAFVPDASGDAGCGNCGADYPPSAPGRRSRMRPVPPAVPVEEERG